MHLLLVTKDLEDNSTGRAYVLWLIARSLGWSAQVVAPKGARVWGPVASQAFASDCFTAERGHDNWLKFGARADLIVSVKPVPGSFDVALELARRLSKPLLLDIDDPDLEAILGEGSPARAIGKAILRARTFWPALGLRRRIARLPVIVSNPVLAEKYGGTVVPHAREDMGIGSPHETDRPRVVFVGTNRAHKGVEDLRAAVALVADKGVSLTITDSPPSDAQPFEDWVGRTTLAQGVSLVKTGDIVVIPSVGRNRYSAGQLPVKIVDAMLAGRALVVSDLAPLRWATGDAARTFTPGDVSELATRLAELTDPRLRAEIGVRARERALSMFTVDSVRDEFERVCRQSIEAI